MEERRQFVRVKAKLYVGYRTLYPPAIEGHCWSKDISVGGIGLIMKDKIDFGIMMELRIGLHDSLRPLIVKSKLFWQVENPEARADKEKYYRTGLIFTDLSETDKNRIDNFINGIIKKVNK